MLGQDLEGYLPVQAAVFGEIDLAHTPLADFLKNLVMWLMFSPTMDPPHCAMQLRPMLRLEGVKGNGKDQLQTARTGRFIRVSPRGSHTAHQSVR